MLRPAVPLVPLVIAAALFGTPLHAQEDRAVLTVSLTEPHREAIEDAPGRLTWAMIGEDLSQHLRVQIQPGKAWVGPKATRTIRLVAVTVNSEGEVVDRTESEPIKVTAEEAAGGEYRPRLPKNPFPGLNINLPSEDNLPHQVRSPEVAVSPEDLDESVPEDLRAEFEERVGIIVYARFAGAEGPDALVRPLLVTVVPRPRAARNSGRSATLE